MLETEIVKTLVDYLQEHPDVDQSFKRAFDKASASGVLKKYNIFTPDDHFKWLDSRFQWIPSATTATHVHEQFCLFFYVFNLDPLEDLFTTDTHDGYTWLSRWITEYSQRIIEFMDTPESISEAAIATFYKSDIYHMQDYIAPSGGWKSINDLFARHIDPSIRPVAEPGNDKVILSPADASYSGCWDISNNGIVNICAVKGVPWNLSVLFQNEEYAQHFKEGRFIHLSVDCHDYHRQHAPVHGIVKDAKVIPGICYLGVDVVQDKAGEPQFIARRRLTNSMGHDLEEKDACKGYQILQSRGFVLIDNPIFGLVCILVVGIGQTIPISLAVNADDKILKGQEISTCRMGGCDVFVFFQTNPGIDFSFPEYAFPPQVFKMGEGISAAM